MLNTKFIGLDALGAFRDKVLAGYILGQDSGTLVPAGTKAKSYAIYYVKSGDNYIPADPQPTEGTSLPGNTYYMIDEGSPSDITRGASVRAVVNYLNSIIETEIAPALDAKVSSVSYDASTKKLKYFNGGSHDIVTLGDNAFTNTEIPTEYLSGASASGNTLTLTKMDDGTSSSVTFTPANTTYTFAEGSTSGAFSVTPSGGTAQSVSIHGLGTAAYSDSTAFLGASEKAVAAETADAVAWAGVNNKPTTLAGYGITDAKISNGTITLGSNTITPITEQYVHPTGDGNLHVPATGTTHNGNVLVSGSTAGSASWKTLADAGISATSHNHDDRYLGKTAKAVSAESADAVNLSGVNGADDLKAIEALTGTSGFLKKNGANTWILDTNTYNNYVHPTTTAHSAAAVKVGNDGEGHVVLGDALTYSDVGAASSGHNHDSLYLGKTSKAVSAESADAVDLSGVNNADDLKAIEALSGTSGFLKKNGANTWILDTNTYNNYVHPTTDGNLHVPATSTTSNGKVLVAGSTAGSFSWKTLADAGISATSHNHDSLYLGKTAKAVSAESADAVNWTGVNNRPTKLSQFTDDLGSSPTHTHSQYSTTDTKNTAGATANTSNKLFIVGATAQSANPQTYTNVNAYVDSSGYLYSHAAKIDVDALATKTYVDDQIAAAIGAAIAASY